MTCGQCEVNKGRAERIAVVLSAHEQYDLEVEKEAAVVDALTDLRHLCDLKGWSFGQLDRVAHQHYLEELREE